MKNLLTLCCLLISVNLIAQNQKGFSVSSTSQNPASGKTYALIVGISKYQNPNIPQLQFADRDAVAFRNYLVVSGVDSTNITLLLNEQARYSDILLDLDDLCTDIIKPGDKIYFYFSGHGDVESRVITNDGYLLPYDAPSKVYAISAIKIQTLQSYISTLSAKGAQVILITDACHSGNLAGGIDGLKNIQKILKESWKDDTKILSCQPGEISLEGKEWGNGRGLFSYELINGIAGLADKNKDGNVNLRELNLYLMDNVADEASPMPQNPMVMGNMETNISTVNQNYLAFLNTSQTNQSFTAIDLKGNEEGLFKGLPDSIIKLYRLFKVALDSSEFINRKDSLKPTAYHYFKRMPLNENTKLIVALMMRNFAAKIIEEVDSNIQFCFHQEDWVYSFSNNAYGSLLVNDEDPILLEMLLGTTKTAEIGLLPKLLFIRALSYGANMAIIKYYNGSYGFATTYGSKLGLKYLDSAIVIDPDAAYALQLRADIHRRCKEYDMALKQSKKANQIAPKFLMPIKTVIFTFEDLHQFDSSIVWLRKFVLADSSHSEDVYFEFGKCFYMLGKVDSSNFYFEKAFAHNQEFQSQNKKDIKRSLLLSEFCFHSENYENAIKIAKDMFQFDDSASYHVCWILAKCYGQLCEIDSAMKYLRFGSKNKLFNPKYFSDMKCIADNQEFQSLVKHYGVRKSTKPNQFQRDMRKEEEDYPDLFFNEGEK